MRIVAGLLFACMIAGSIPAEAVYGADVDVENGQSQDQNLPENEQNTESTDGGENSVSENGEIQGQPDENHTASEAEPSEVIADDEAAAEDEMMQTDETEIENTDDTETEESGDIGTGEINFVYVESPYLATPDTQRIVFAFDQVISGADAITLTVKDDAGNQEEWDLSRQTDNLYLFEKEYTGDAYTGTYHATSLNLYAAETEKNIVLDEIGVEAEFGVNQEYDGIEELKPLDDGMTEEEAAQVEASVVTIDEEGVPTAQDSIADALDTVAGENAEENGISTFSAEQNSRARSGNIVVALDPGHDAWDAGARGNGLEEEDLTLKIANYCKEELEQYSGVTVYMTRTTDACPYGIWGVGCIPKRVEAAAKAGAQIFVSFHLNSSTSSSAHGAEIIVPNYSWKYEVGAEGRELAEAILDELIKAGVDARNTPIYSKDTTINERYPDGSISDYFGVQIYCKEYGIPGLIVEHAFISNSGDANKFLKTEAGLKSLGVADATGIAKYLGLSKGYWDGDYYYVDGQPVKGEYCIGGKWYYFDEVTGRLQLGFQTVGTRTVYYTRENGMAFGECLIDGKWYYFSKANGNLQLGFQTVGTRTVYYTQKDGMLFGEQCIDGKFYYFDVNNGNVKLGFQKIGSRTVYYTLKDGMLFGKQEINGKQYWFDEKNGNVKLGFQEIDGNTVYFTLEDGMIFGEYCIDGKWYYFDKSTGKLLLGFQTVGSRTVYYTEEEGMLFGEQCIDNKWYYFSEANGNLLLGFQKVGSRTVYYTRSDGMIFGPYTIDGKNYYFSESNGNMARSEWVNGKYYDENGIESAESQIPIMGETQTTVTQMMNYYSSSGAVYPQFYENSDAPTLKEFCTIYYEEAKAQGIRAEIAFAQAMKETGWLRYGGDVKIEQYNFAGLGAVGGGANGASFNSVREGVRAQIQHLFAYASPEGESGLVYPCVDGRFNLVSPKGGAPYVEWLGKQENPVPGYGWATAANYGVDIASMVNNLLRCSK